MPWQYEDSTGVLTKDGTYVDTGYSGNGAGLNNPNDASIPNVGPIVPGPYMIGAPKNPVDQLGPFAMPLTPMMEPIISPHPVSQEQAAQIAAEHARSGFFIHGDNALMNHTASHGCIILKRQTRIMIAASDDRQLIVVP
jgi:hypothetical protein